MEQTKLIEILDPKRPQDGAKETILQDRTPSVDDMTEMFRDYVGRRRSLYETAITTSNFPQLMQDGLRTILFNSYAGVASTWQEWVQVVDSDRPDETWLKDSHLGLLPRVPENDPFPELELNLDSAVTITNAKRGGIIPITWEMLRYDKYNVIRQMVEGLGRAMASTKDQDAYNVLTTTGNYTLNSTTNDNDIGANTATLTFSPKGLNTAVTTLKTMKGRKSGEYIGVSPDTLIIGPRMEVFVKQLLMSDLVMRVGGSSAAEELGTGTANSFRGLIRNIIVSPRMGAPAYCWALLEAKRPIVCQNVLDVELLATESVANNHDFLTRDVNKFRARAVYEFGMVDEHFAFYSDSTTEPIVD